ncbi:MAG: YheC/YheD family protein [Bacillota bacterium]
MPPYQIVRSKMEKTRALLSDPVLARYIPKTELYSPDNLKKMLSDYSLVYVKPDRGSGGGRVISIGLKASKLCRVHYETKIQQDLTMEAVHSFIAGIAGGDRFIIQQGIKLLTIDGKPVDLRIHLQRPYSRWEVTGWLVKIAAPGKAVTNRRRGGKLVDFNTALLRAGLNKSSIVKTANRLSYLCSRTAFVLNRRYAGLRELGVDIALDQNARPWILEVNTRPEFPRGNRIVDRYHEIIVRKKRI